MRNIDLVSTCSDLAATIEQMKCHEEILGSRGADTGICSGAGRPASAGNISSNDGNGYQGVTYHGDQSFSSTGKLRSNTGNNVYIRGVVIYNNYTDYTCNRITSNTNSSSYVSKSGSCSQATSIPPSADGAGWKICRYRTGLPDGCGSQDNDYW